MNYKVYPIRTYHNKKCPRCKRKLNIPTDDIFICDNCKYAGYVYHFDGKNSHFQDADFNPSKRQTVSFPARFIKNKNPSRRY